MIGVEFVILLGMGQEVAKNGKSLKSKKTNSLSSFVATSCKEVNGR